jgi:two-component system, OmpR family, copper resistance phosphate regulon response regulator CusR
MKVLLIEDEQKTAQSIQLWLEEAGIQVDYAADGFSGQRLGTRNTYDVIVTDVILPQINGVDLCRFFREEGIQTPILVLSALSQPEDKVNGLNAGADDYLAKPFDFHELLARINALTRRATQQVNPAQKLTFADLELNLDTLEAWRAGSKIILTPREFALLEYFVRNQGRVLPKTEIAEKVWNIDAEINTNVIEVYVGYLRNKVDKGFSKPLIHTHFGVGYIMKND